MAEKITLEFTSVETAAKKVFSDYYKLLFGTDSEATMLSWLISQAELNGFDSDALIPLYSKESDIFYFFEKNLTIKDFITKENYKAVSVEAERLGGYLALHSRIKLFSEVPPYLTIEDLEDFQELINRLYNSFCNNRDVLIEHGETDIEIIKNCPLSMGASSTLARNLPIYDDGLKTFIARFDIKLIREDLFNLKKTIIENILDSNADIFSNCKLDDKSKFALILLENETDNFHLINRYSADINNILKPTLTNKYIQSVGALNSIFSFANSITNIYSPEKVNSILNVFDEHADLKDYLAPDYGFYFHQLLHENNSATFLDKAFETLSSLKNKETENTAEMYKRFQKTFGFNTTPLVYLQEGISAGIARTPSQLVYKGILQFSLTDREYKACKFIRENRVLTVSDFIEITNTKRDVADIHYTWHRDCFKTLTKKLAAYGLKFDDVFEFNSSVGITFRS